MSKDLRLEWLNDVVPAASVQVALDGFIIGIEQGCSNGQRQDCRRLESSTRAATNDAVHGGGDDDEFISAHAIARDEPSTGNHARFENFRIERV